MEEKKGWLDDMGRVSQIDPKTASDEVKEAIRSHLAEGHALTNEKKTLLHNVAAFKAVEEASYDLDDDLQRLIGKLDADLFEYAISVTNECLVCTTYFSKLLREQHHGADSQPYDCASPDCGQRKMEPADPSGLCVQPGAGLGHRVLSDPARGDCTSDMEVKICQGLH